MKRRTQAALFVISVCAYAAYLGLKPKQKVYNILIDHPPPISWRNQTERRLDALVINGDDNYRNIVKKSEEGGLKDLRSLVSGGYEEIWMYTPANSTWTEVGISALVKRRVGDLNIISRSPRFSKASDYVNELIHSYDKLVMYHLCPTNDVMETAKSMDSETRNKLQILRALPSKEHLVSMFKLSSEFYSEKPSGKLSFRIITQLGIVEYDLTPEGRDMMVTGNRDSLKEFSLIRPGISSVSDPILEINKIFKSANNQQNIFRFYFLPYN